MFIEMWPNLAFDPHGTNTNNDIKDEVQKLTDKTCPWIVPNGAPFVAGSVKIKTSDGQLVKTGWKECFKPMPLIEITGLDMNTFIELDAELLEQYDDLVISYHSVGVSYLPRSTLEEQLQAIIHGAESIPWSKVIQIPDTLPPSEHWHLPEELLGWDDIVMFCRYVLAVAERQVRTQQNMEEIYDNVRDVLDKLIAQYNLVNNKLAVHGSNYSNPHHVTAFDLLLGNVDNFATATVQQDIDGTRADLFSTPAGAIQAVQKQTPDTSGLMKNGTLPISMLGSSDYLPPVIDGSFEGIGTDTNMAAICLENNGRVMMIKRHFDGRVKALYFSYIDDYKASRPNLLFTGFKYENPQLKAAGYVLDTVIRGSGQDVLVVGDSSKNKWWVSLTNGTLNPATHVFTEINLSGIPHQDFQQSYYPNTVMSTKNWIIICAGTPDSGSNGQAFYRIPKSSLGQGNVLTPSLLNVNYTDLAGRVKNGQQWFYPDETARDANGMITRYLWNFSPVTRAISYRFSDPIFFAEESTDVLVMRFHLRPFIFDDQRVPQTNFYMNFQFAYRLNVTNGQMTLLDSSPIVTADTTSGVYPPNAESVSFVDQSVGIDFACAAVVLPTGDYIYVVSQNSTTTFPMQLGVAVTAASNAADGVKTHLLNSNITYTRTNQAVAAPTAEGTSALHPVWDREGEFVPCWDKGGQNQVNIYRKVSGGYASRPGLTNVKLGNLLGRPLVNTVYTTNVGFNYPMAMFTGDSAALDAAGVECGDMSASVFQCLYTNGGWQQQMPNSPGISLWIDSLFGAIRTFNKVYNDDTLNMTVAPTSYYAISPAVLNQIKAMFVTEAAQMTYAVIKVFVPYQAQATTSLAAGLPCFAQIMGYSDIDKSMIMGQVIALNLQQATYTTGAVGVPVIQLSNPTLVRQSSVWRDKRQGTNRNIYIPTQGGSNHWPFYKQGNQYAVKLHTGWMISVPGGAYAPSFDYVWDVSSQNFVSQGWRGTGYGREETLPVIPRVGYGTQYDRSYTGAAVMIANVNNQNYLLASVYPDSGWIIYFKDGTKLVINGTSYDAPTGTVDLRDIDPAPANKTFYVYVTCYGDTAYYIVSGKRIRHNLSLIPAAKIVTNDKQILTIERYSTFMIGDAILSTSRKAGSIPVSIGMPMDEGTLSYVYQHDLPSS
jgi:hypothetical protein